MSDPRMTGLALMAISTAAFVGTTSNSLPPVAFFPALALFAVGAIKFVLSNHSVIEETEKRDPRAANPIMRENRHAPGHAERRAAQRDTALDHSGAEGRNANTVASDAQAPISPRDGIELGEPQKDFMAATDVSVPVEVQTGNALADQLGKLNQLLEQGVLTEEEYAVAKTKLLS